MQIIQCQLVSWNLVISSEFAHRLDVLHLLQELQAYKLCPSVTSKFWYLVVLFNLGSNTLISNKFLSRPKPQNRPLKQHGTSHYKLDNVCRIFIFAYQGMYQVNTSNFCSYSWFLSRKFSLRYNLSWYLKFIPEMSMILVSIQNFYT